jgi:hypothetical protein
MAPADSTRRAAANGNSSTWKAGAESQQAWQEGIAAADRLIGSSNWIEMAATPNGLLQANSIFLASGSGPRLALKAAAKST